MMEVPSIFHYDVQVHHRVIAQRPEKIFKKRKLQSSYSAFGSLHLVYQIGPAAKSTTTLARLSSMGMVELP